MVVALQAGEVVFQNPGRLHKMNPHTPFAVDREYEVRGQLHTGLENTKRGITVGMH